VEGKKDAAAAVVQGPDFSKTRGRRAKCLPMQRKKKTTRGERNEEIAKVWTDSRGGTKTKCGTNKNKVQERCIAEIPESKAAHLRRGSSACAEFRRNWEPGKETRVKKWRGAGGPTTR